MKTRREFLKLSLSAVPAVALASTGTEALAANAERPNIIYFICHDLGRMISPYGAKVATPNLQAFSESALTLTNAYCSSPACAPSRGCSMTGRYAHNTGLMGVNDMGNPALWQLRPDEKTVVNYLNDAGYMTVHCGFQHERVIGKPVPGAPNPNGYQVDFPKGWPDCFVEGAVNDAVKWLKSRDSKEKRPFYLNIGSQEAHGSCCYGELSEKYGRMKIYGGPDPEDKVWIPENFVDNAMSRKILSTFWPCVRYLDQEFGRLIREIDALGYGKNTIVVFATDHGACGPRHKGRIYDSGTEIATMIRYPGKIPAGKRSDALITNIDYCPTWLEAAGVPTPKSVSGRSFWPLLTGAKYTPNETVFIERNYHNNYDPMRSVRTRDFLYIRNFHPKARYAYTPAETLALPPPQNKDWPNRVIESKPFSDPVFKNWPLRAHEELYDLKKDPFQYHNVAAQPEYAAVLKPLAAKLEDWMKKTDDVLLQGVVSAGTGTLT